MQPRLDSQAMDDTARSSEYHSGTPLFRKWFIPVLDFHVPLREVACVVLEVFAVHRQHLAEYLAFDLVDDVVEGVAIHEGSFCRAVAMHVKEKGQALLGV